MNFATVKSLTIPEGNVVKILSGSLVLWSKGSSPSPQDGYQLLYLQNGDDDSGDMQRDWSINTGITWRNVFVNSSSLGLSYPGLETEIVYLYSNVPPEGGLIAGCNPRYNQEFGEGDRDMGGFWRIFGHGGAQFCFDCPSEDDRLSVGSEGMTANRIYTENCKYGYLGTSDLRTYMEVTWDGQEDPSSWEGYMGDLSYSWRDANLPHNIYLWSDNSQSEGDTAPRGGVRIYKFTAWYLENGVRHTKIYEGVPWMDGNNVPCIKDLVSGVKQYNCASNPQAFLYGEIQ